MNCFSVCGCLAGFPASLPRSHRESSASRRAPLPSQASCSKACDIVTLLRRHPHLLTGTPMRYPAKTLALLRSSDVAALHGVVDALPREVLSAVLDRILCDVSMETCQFSVAPLMSCVDIRDALVGVLKVIRPEDAALLLEEVPTENLLTVMTVAAEKLVGFMGNITPERHARAVVPLMQESHEFITNRLNVLLTAAAHPERIADMVNYIAVQAMISVMWGVDPEKIAALADIADEVDFRPGGPVADLMDALSQEPLVLENHVVPLLQRGDMGKIVSFIKQVRLGSMLSILRSSDADILVSLVSNLDARLAATATDSELKAMIAAAAAPQLADVMQDRTMAIVIQSASRAIGQGLTELDVAWQSFESAKRHGKHGHGLESSAISGIFNMQMGLLAEPGGSREPEYVAVLDDEAQRDDTLTAWITPFLATTFSSPQVDNSVCMSDAAASSSSGSSTSLTSSGSQSISSYFASSQGSIPSYGAQNFIYGPVPDDKAQTDNTTPGWITPLLATTFSSPPGDTGVCMAQNFESTGAGLAGSAISGICDMHTGFFAERGGSQEEYGGSHKECGPVLDDEAKADDILTGWITPLLATTFSSPQVDNGVCRAQNFQPVHH